ncbi:hypothetical protein [Falsiroseomonas sp.]|uniref:hypothetical protein n=1 Tax=Falsiroseomonas sp. TaxID=2870721 RepID=UPI003563F6FF
MRRTLMLPAAVALLTALGLAADAQTPAPDAARNMTFFVTSIGIGRGADLGGLAGGDAHCQALASAAGAGQRTWRAYLSTQGSGAVNARDRIGTGPWQNANGVVIARSVAELHSPANAMTKQTNVDERGQLVNGRGDTPNRHDILTGSQEDGTAFSGAEDRTCRNWTYSGQDGSAMLGHHDRVGLRDDAPSRSWNTSHPSRGCSQDNLRSTGGAGLFYCFATD